MARLLEYEGKELFSKANINIPQGKATDNLKEAQKIAEEIGYPVMVKAQIYQGNRGKIGAIKSAKDPGELQQVVTNLLDSKIGSLNVDKILIEKKMLFEKEFYLGITSNPATRQPALIFSDAGGMDIEELAQSQPEKIITQSIDISEGLYDYQARDALRKCSTVKNKELVRTADIASKLYRIYRENDCKLVEINPLVVDEDGNIIAADARVDIDDDAVWRNPDLGLASAEEAGDRPATYLETEAGRIDEGDHRGSAHFVQIDPDGSYAKEIGKISIGYNTVGTGCGLTLLDEVVPLGYYPVNFCDTSGNPTSLKMYAATKIIFSQPIIKGYIFVTGVAAQLLDNTARGIIKALKELYPDTGGKPNIPCVFVFRGRSDDIALKLFEEHGISDSPMVKMMGRKATERDAARAFDDLYKQWISG